MLVPCVCCCLKFLAVQLHCYQRHSLFELIIQITTTGIGKGYSILIKSMHMLLFIAKIFLLQVYT